MSTPHTPSRAYFQAPFAEFLNSSDEAILGCLSQRSELSLEQAQRNAWVEEIDILKEALQELEGHILLEYTIPRMGRRADAVLLLPGSVVVVEFKVGESSYSNHALDQVFNYALDLKNFHEGSHNKSIVPLLMATEAAECPVSFTCYPDLLYDPVCANRGNLASVISEVTEHVQGPVVDPTAWMGSGYRPTPTIVEAAQALYRGHDIKEISRSESGAENLTKTADSIRQIVSESRAEGRKSICFVTGVPGAGKTLAGLNIANSWHDPENYEHAVFLSGNGPLVLVLREALARDRVAKAKAAGEKLPKSAALSEVIAFVQNVHNFRDDTLEDPAAPIEKVVIFDEAQRAWDKRQTASFMKRRKNRPGFDMSEPEFLISVMDRHEDWAVLACLVGGGQEINTGEAGLAEWFRVLASKYPGWSVYVSDKVDDSEHMDELARQEIENIAQLVYKSDLHLATSVRSFRAEHVAAFVKALLDCKADEAKELLGRVLPKYPVFLTRNIEAAKGWLRRKARGNERYGVIASSEAQRLKPFGINVNADIDPANWFLNGKDDIRSSYYLEDVATEFQIQGLELDWTCVAWDGDLRFGDGDWDYNCFRGSKWMRIRNERNQKYLKNAYRVLLTRALQGMVIFVPKGDETDHTRKCEYYDRTYEYLRSLGMPGPPPA